MLPLRPSASRFPLPDWEQVHASIKTETHDIDQSHASWTEHGREWVHLLRQSLGETYRGYESAHFWLVSSQPENVNRRLIAWAEDTRAKVLKAIEIDARENHFGKCPMLVLADLDTYYEYTSAYLPDGDHALSGGMCINRGFAHFVFAFQDLTDAQRVLAHELAHAMVVHLPLPAWLNEGVAQLCEMSVTGRDPCNYEQLRDTIAEYWNEESIRDFWTGRGFNRQDEGQMHSYHLAKVLAGWLAKNRKRFIPFLREAHFSDAGEAALVRHYGFGLAELVTEYLGEGPWAPVFAPIPDTTEEPNPPPTPE